MKDFLAHIQAYKKREIAEAKVRIPQATLERQARDQSPPRGFVKALEWARNAQRFGLIAEIKRASPSKGVICDNVDVAAVARAYQEGGASCLSVLTDAPSFQGSAQDLHRARAASHLPILRKDFLYDPYQVLEARAWGADCILIILAAVDDETARSLNKAAHDWGLDVLLEVHNEQELERALSLETRLIGINNRDLRSFTTSLSVCERLAARVPADRLIVAESGITSHADCRHLSQFNINAFLVGEALMRQKSIAAAAQTLLTGMAPV